MPNFVAFFEQLLDVVLNFLMADPIIWFVGCFFLLFACGIVRKILHIGQ